MSEGASVATVGTSGDPEAAEPYVHLGIRTTADEQGYVDPLALLPTRATPDPAGPPATAPAPVQPAAAAPTPEATNPQPHAPAHRRRSCPAGAAGAAHGGGGSLQRACADSGTGSSGPSRREPGARSGVCRHPVLGGRRRRVRAGCPGAADAFVGAFVGGEARGIRTCEDCDAGGCQTARPASIFASAGRRAAGGTARAGGGAAPAPHLGARSRGHGNATRDDPRTADASHRRHAGTARGAYSYAGANLEVAVHRWPGYRRRRSRPWGGRPARLVSETPRRGHGARLSRLSCRL